MGIPFPHNLGCVFVSNTAISSFLTDLSAFNSLWCLDGHISIWKGLEDIFRNSPGFLSSQAGVETGTHMDGFHRDHRDLWSRVGAPGHTVTSSLFAFLPSSHSFHSICLKKGVFSLFLHGSRASGGNQALPPCGWVPLQPIISCRGSITGKKSLRRPGANSCWNPRQPQSFHPFLSSMWCKSAFFVRLTPHCKIRSSWGGKKGWNSHLQRSWQQITAPGFWCCLWKEQLHHWTSLDKRGYARSQFLLKNR